MTEDLYDSAVRSSGDLAAFFEYDGTVGYFYLYDVEREDRTKIIGSLRVLSGETNLGITDISVRWNHDETRVALFVRGIQWAVFNTVSGKKYGGDRLRDQNYEIPEAEVFQ